MKDGDIYRWKYTPEKLKEKDDGNNGGTTYWCCSRIGIWSAEKGRLIDTYWHSGSGHWFTADDIGKIITITYVENLNNLRSVDKCEFNSYDDSDCIDISHANMIRGGFYIKKTATPSIDKKRRVLLAHIEHHKRKARSHEADAVRYLELLENLTVDTYVPCNSDVYIPSE
ncbi:MAG: hypothetical protein PVG39_02175 [Desulfobacteraceae bacterium]|jgi:hypothetical protein